MGCAASLMANKPYMGCAASLMANKPWTAEDYVKYDQIKQMWAKMDADDSGYIEIRELKLQMDKGGGRKVDMQAVKLAFEKVDVDKSGKITFDEFCKYNGLTITDEVRQHLDARGRAKFEEGEVDVEKRTDGHGHLIKDKQNSKESDKNEQKEPEKPIMSQPLDKEA